MNNEEQHILQKHLARFITNDVFNVISEDDLLNIKGKEWKHNGRTLDITEIKNLIEQAQLMERLKLWAMLKTELKYHAQDRLTNKSKTESDLIAGKMMIYIIELLENRVKYISNFKIE